MSDNGLAAVLLMIGAVMLVICFWKQIAIFLLFMSVTVFCFGVSFVVSRTTDMCLDRHIAFWQSSGKRKGRRRAPRWEGTRQTNQMAQNSPLRLFGGTTLRRRSRSRSGD